MNSLGLIGSIVSPVIKKENNMKKTLILLLFILVPLTSYMPFNDPQQYWYDTYPNWDLWDAETQDVVMRLEVQRRVKTHKDIYLSREGIRKLQQYELWKISVPLSYYEGLKSWNARS